MQKGPFVLGSSIAISVLDASGNPTGAVFDTQTTSDKGEFALTLTASGPLSLEGSGFYYNEATGQLSTGNLTLRAMYVAASGETQSAFINVITHLTYGRVKKLITSGKSFDDATLQAENELRTALAITPPSFDPGGRGIGMNELGGDSDANAYLFAVSAVLAQAGAAQGTPDAALQQLINAMAISLEDDGTLDATSTASIAQGLKALDTKAVAS